MSLALEKIEHFIEKHHVMSLATSSALGELSACSLFYIYDSESLSFVVASSKETQHIKNTTHNSKVAGNILLETKKVGEIKGLQFKANFKALSENRLKLLYFKAFPYALALAPTLWKVEVKSFKLTDNTLGFGKKIIWSESSV